MADRPGVRRRSAPQLEYNALLASAAHLTEARSDDPTYARWQDEGWARYDELGEFRSGVTWHGNVLSRARLVAAHAPQSPGDAPTPIELPDPDDPAALREDAKTRDADQLAADQTAVELVRQIASGIGGQSELLRSSAVHLDVPGEGWFVGAVEGLPGVEADQLDDVSWRFYSADELRRKDTPEGVRYEVERGEGDWLSLGANVLPVRVWRPHERRHWMADSSTRPALNTLAELSLVNRRIVAVMQSRLAMNGIYWVPSEITFPPNPAYKDAPDPFVAEFMDLAQTAIRTPGSAAAAIPFVARAPSQYIGALRHDQFVDLVDERDLELREQTIHRLAGHFDWPAEVMLGTGDMNHWGQWQMEESAIKTVVTPFLELVVWALTTGYYRPALAAAQLPPREYVVWFDVSDLVTRPDRSQAAMEGEERLIVSTDATLREIGMGDDDAPSDEEVRIKLLRTLLTHPTLAPMAADELGLFKKHDPMAAETPPAAPGGGEPASPGDTPVPDVQPVQGPPDTRENQPPAAAPSTNGGPATQPSTPR